ncbi:FGGY family carbohydrate kinase [Christensenella tenuis]|uniref:Carbohydrate kinase FGGY N-terminal domain-containing protein n=1 Tax=Christensenella tenuis TaxID=2763033 RepID=A0ABR7EDD3_9FIRM|nr:FGGY family carbohydrate kinase [Christensenella tenuis]MBC5647761.1 hypothetical protein [Christensenella tenuis]
MRSRRNTKHGFVEQNPDDWWRVVCAASAELLKLIDPKDVAAVSFSGQMTGCLCADRHGKPLCPSIIWAGTHSVCEADLPGNKYRKAAFYRVSVRCTIVYHTVVKLMWMKKNELEVYRNTHKTLCAKDYIVLKLTGQFVTGYSDAPGRSYIIFVSAGRRKVSCRQRYVPRIRLGGIFIRQGSAQYCALPCFLL